MHQQYNTNTQFDTPTNTTRGYQRNRHTTGLACSVAHRTPQSDF